MTGQTQYGTKLFASVEERKKKDWVRGENNTVYSITCNDLSKNEFLLYINFIKHIYEIQIVIC